MKKKFIFIAVLAAFALTGCGNEVPATSIGKTEPTTVVTTESATEPTTNADSEVKIIGTKKDGDSVYKVQFINSTGKDITGFTVKPDQEKDYPANMMAKGDVFGKKEIRELYYDTKNIPETNNENTDGNSPVLSTAYTIKVDFSDNTAALLHQFPFEDAKSVILKFEDDVLYIVYKSETSGTEVNTKEAEKMIKETPDTPYDTDTTPNNDNNDTQSDNNNSNSSSNDNNNSGSGSDNNTQSYTPQPDNNSAAQGGGQAQQTPVTPTPTDPPVVTPAPTEAPANDGNSGCLSGGALFNDGDSSGGNSDSGCLGDGALFN